MINIQYIFFISAATISLSLLFLKNRRFDFISIYILLLFLYSITLFFGVVSNPYTGSFVSPDPDIYIVMGIAFLGTSVYLLQPNGNTNKIIRRDYLDEKIALSLYTILSIIGFLLFIPIILSSSSKVDLLENTNSVTSFISSILYTNFPVVGFLVALKIKNKKFIIFFSIMLIFLLIFGGRKSLTTVFLGAAIITLDKSSLRLISKYRFFILSLIVLLILILSKTFYGYALAYGPILGANYWLENFEIRYLFIGSEFLNISAILNAVLENNFSTDKIYYFYSFLAILPLPLSIFNYSSSYFNDQFQPALFPGISYGMAYNIWAEVYSAFGYLGVLCLSLYIPFILSTLWKIYLKSKNVFSILILVIGVTFAFWIHRNSLATIFAYTRNIFYPLIIVHFCIMFLKQIMRLRN